jgi:hypothetical protein
MKRHSILLLAVAFAAVLGCSQGTPVTGEDQKKVLEYADPVADNLLAGFNDGSYAVYSRDFDEMMKNGLPENVFTQTRGMILDKIGKYKSRTLDRVVKKEQFIAVMYNAEFEKESGVSVKVVFAKYTDKHLVSGLWFNSPKLRQ